MTSRMLGVDPVRSRRIEPAHVGCLVDSDGSRRLQTDRLDDQMDDQGASDRRSDGTPARSTRWIGASQRPPAGASLSTRPAAHDLQAGRVGGRSERCRDSNLDRHNRGLLRRIWAAHVGWADPDGSVRSSKDLPRGSDCNDAGDLAADKVEQVGVELVLVWGDLGQAVGGARIDLQGRVLDQLDGPAG